MLRGIYAAAAGMQIQDMRQEAITNNLANVSTAGFKRSVMAFAADYWGWMGRLNDDFAKTPKGVKDKRPVIGFMRGSTMLAREAKDWTEGTLNSTGGPLDVAIREPYDRTQAVPGEHQADHVHMFTLEDTSGQRYYTRNGEFELNAEGFLVTKGGGYFVMVKNPLTEQVGPIRITVRRPDDEMPYTEAPGDVTRLDEDDIPFTHMAGQIRIDESGFISIEDVGDAPGGASAVQQRPVGWLVISRLPTEGVLQKGENIWTLNNDMLDPTDPNSRPIAEEILPGCGPNAPIIRSEVREGSNVSVVREMVALLAANRIYEMNSRLIRAQDELLGRTVLDVGRSVR